MKAKIEKRERPKTVLRSRIVKTVFWTLVAYLFLVSTLALARSGDTNHLTEEGTVSESPKVNEATGPGAMSFIQNFSAHYFNWSKSNPNDRAERLKVYLAQGMDAQAGFSFENVRFDSRQEKSQIWRVEETGENQANVTVRVQQVLLKGKQEVKTITRYLVVPIQAKDHNFAVVKPPYFTAMPQPADVKIQAQETQGERVADADVNKEAEMFLKSFLKVYASGTDEEIQYFTKGTTIEGLHGTLVFRGFRNLNLYPGATNNTYKAELTAVLVDTESKATYLTPLRLQIVNENNRYFVTELIHN